MRRSSYVHRSGYGLDTPSETDWRQRGLCRDDPDCWSSDVAAQISHARHVCLEHCPVRAECAADTATVEPNRRIGLVLAGVAYGDAGRPRRYQPKVAERCGRC